MRGQNNRLLLNKGGFYYENYEEYKAKKIPRA